MQLHYILDYEENVIELVERRLWAIPIMEEPKFRFRSHQMIKRDIIVPSGDGYRTYSGYYEDSEEGDYKFGCEQAGFFGLKKPEHPMHTSMKVEEVHRVTFKHNDKQEIIELPLETLHWPTGRLLQELAMIKMGVK